MDPFGDTLQRIRRRIFPLNDAQIAARLHALPPSLPPRPPSAVIAASLPSATSQSPLFRRLPAEVRQQILVAAFGDRLVHMHLSIDRPLPRKHRGRCGRSLSTGHARHPGRNNFDHLAPPFWRWRSSRCHSSNCFAHDCWARRVPQIGDGSFGVGGLDSCVAGECCGHADAPESCGIGAFGWLLTCRQAYREGYQVLHGANTVRLHGTFMFAHLPELIPRLSLETLTMVSLYWDLGWLRDYPRRAQPGQHPEEYSFLEGFQELLPRLPSTLPNVKRLHLSLYGVFGDGEQWTAYGKRSAVVHAQVEALTHMLLSQVLRMPRMSDLRLELPRSMFMPWVQEILDVTLEFEEACCAELPAEWLRREVPVDLIVNEERKAQMDAFWVLLGISDLPPLTVRCFC